MSDYRDEYTSKLKKVTTPGASRPTSGRTSAAPAFERPQPPQRQKNKQTKAAHTKKTDSPAKKMGSVQVSPGKKKQARGRRIGFAVFFIVIAVLIVVAIAGPHISAGVKTSFVQNGTLEKSSDGTAVFLREELTVAAETEGKLIAGINEGERAAKGEVVAYVVDDQMEEAVEELKKVEDRILSAQTYNDSMLESVSSSLNEINSAVIGEVLALTPESAKGCLRSFSDIQNNIETYFELKNDMTMNVETKDAYILSLQTKRKEILDRLDGHMHALTAPESGIVSYCLDGRESTVSAMDFENVTVDMLSDFTSNASKSIGRTVKRGGNVFRITSTNEYYIAVTLADGGQSVKRNANVTVQADNRSFKTNASVVSVTDTGDGSTMVLLKSTSNMSTTISYRTQDVHVIFEAVAGLKVPVKVLTDWDSAGLTAKITLIRSNYVECVYVNVESYNDEYAIITNQTAFDPETEEKGVQANDMVVLNPESVKEGELIA